MKNISVNEGKSWWLLKKRLEDYASANDQIPLVLQYMYLQYA